MAKRIVPSDFKTHLIDQLIESVSEPANTVYYAFIGDHIAAGDTQEEVAQPTTSSRQLNIQTYRNMILGKRLEPDDFRIMIPRYDWQSGEIYDMYDDQDPNLLQKRFFVAVNETAFIHVYKCLFNNNGAPSTVQPIFNDVSFDENLFEPGDNYYQTSDGYQWKYMYSIDSQTFAKFATQKYIPVVANTTSENNAQNGSIDVVRITEPGKFYNNTIASNFTQVIPDGADATKYILPLGAYNVRDFYKNTIMHITEGTGAGEYRRVVSSNATPSGVQITLEDRFTSDLDQTTRFEISPEVKITSDGTQLVNAVARAIVNANASNSIYRVEVLEPGLGYNFANAEILVGTQGADSGGDSSGELAEIVNAVAVPIIPPPGGHGSNSAIELGGTALEIHAEFIQSENGTVPAENSFAQFGIIRDPLFANVEIKTIPASDANSVLFGYDGEFVEGELVYQFTKKRLFGVFDVVEDSNTVIANTVTTTEELDLGNELSVDDYVYLTSDTQETYNHFTTVSNILGNNGIQLTDAPNWSDSSVSLYYATPTAKAVVNQIVGDSIFLRECDDKFVTDRLMIGSLSHAVGNVQAINVNDRLPENTGVYDFRAFNQTTVLAGNISESFELDEVVFQSETGAEGVVFATEGSGSDTKVYLTRVTGEFDTSKSVIGRSSNAQVLPGFNKYSGELDPTSGNIIYLQNDVAVTRSGNRSEKIRIILEF